MIRLNNIALLILLIGVLAGFGSAQTVTPPTGPDKTTPYKITKDPRAMYTEEASKNRIEGTVILKITLLSTGKIGEIRDVTTVNRERLEASGLTASAISAARGIRFKPKKVNGQPVAVVITRAYPFTMF